MIQNTRYSDPPFKKLSKVQENGIKNFTNVFDESYQEDEDLSIGENEVLSKMDATKKRLGDVAPFLLPKPPKPELDEEQRKNYKGLTKVGALAQVVDALSDVALSRSDSDYRPIPINAGDLAFSAFSKVAEMDYEHKQKLSRYKDQVFQTDVANKQTEGRANEFNKAVDLDIATTKMGFEQANKKAEALKQEAIKKAKTEEEGKKNSAYIDAGLRLISQGEEAGAMQMFKKAGLDVKDANELLGKSPDSPKGKTIDINKKYGIEWTGLDKNMFERYHGLLETIEDKDYRSDGTPSSNKARELEDLKKSLGSKIYLPKDEVLGGPDANEASNKGVGSSKSSTTDKNAKLQQEAEGLFQSLFDGKAKTEEEVQVIQQKIMENGKAQGLSEEEIIEGLESYSNPESGYNQNKIKGINFEGVQPLKGEIDINTEEGSYELKRYTSDIRKRFFATADDNEKSMLLYQLGMNLEDAGIDEEYVDGIIQGILSQKGGAEISNPPEQGFSEEITNDKSQEIQGSKYQLLANYKEGKISLEELRKNDPLLARLVENDKELAPIHKIQDWFETLGEKTQVDSKNIRK